MKIEPIETARLRVRSQTKADTAFCMSIWNDPEMGKYMSDPPIDKVDAEYLADLEGLENSPDGYFVIAEDKATGERIGTCCAFPEKGGVSWDLGYSIHQKFWRQGYATEMVRAVLDFAKAHGAQYATADVAKANAGSNGVMRKLGFAPIGEQTFRKSGTDLCYEGYTYQKNLLDER
jgi:RimJ/RimL family protein N-acetyltransferase